MPRPAITAITFWDRVKTGEINECWEWFGPTSKGKRNPFPYGRVDAFGFNGVYVHRIAYWLANGGTLSLRKNGDLLIRHTCDNTLCCNPKHLKVGTHADNVNDMMERDRQTKWAVSTETPNAKLTAAQVLEIRGQPKESRLKLAAKYGVSIQTIKAVRSRRHYADIT